MSRFARFWSQPMQISEDERGLERIIFFSDAVFAIAITLLALEIRLPAADDLRTDAGLARVLLSVWPNYLAYAVSFIVLGIFWVSHHRKFFYIQRYDSRLMYLNLLFLMLIAFMPFPTALLSEYGGRTATIFYALVILLAGLLLTAVWSYAADHERLIAPRIPQRRLKREFWGALLVSVIFLLSIGLAFINADLAKFSWILVAPAMRFVR